MDNSPQKADDEDDGAKQKNLKRKSKKQKEDPDSEAICSISKSISSLVENVGKKPTSEAGAEPSEPMDDTDIWAKLLASKIRKLDDLCQEEFKFRVDGLILEQLKSQAAMPNI